MCGWGHRGSGWLRSFLSFAKKVLKLERNPALFGSWTQGLSLSSYPSSMGMRGGGGSRKALLLKGDVYQALSSLSPRISGPSGPVSLKIPWRVFNLSPYDEAALLKDHCLLCSPTRYVHQVVKVTRWILATLSGCFPLRYQCWFLKHTFYYEHFQNYRRT